MGLRTACWAFWRALTDREFARALGAGTATAKASSVPALPAPTSNTLSCDGLALLALLQREARLVDFLMESLAGYDDAQVGAVARQLHHSASAALRRSLELAPVIADSEGAQVTVPEGYDPSTIMLSGKVAAMGPHRGQLAHPGWRVTRVNLSAQPSGQDATVLAPAEVDVR